MALFARLFSAGPPSGASETSALLEEVDRLRQASPLVGKVDRVVASIMESAAEEADQTIGLQFGKGVVALIERIYRTEVFAYFPSAEELASDSLAAQADVRKRLRATRDQLRNEKQYLGQWMRVLSGLLADLYSEFPPQAFVDPDEEGAFEEASVLAGTVPLYVLLPDAAATIQRITVAILQAYQDHGVFGALREALVDAACVASGIDPADLGTTSRPLKFPKEQQGMDAGQLVHAYLAGTPFYDLLTQPVPFYVPDAVRFEHTYVLAGTGHGKTQTLQFLIAADLERAIEDQCSVVVMDSQGDLLNTLLHSGFFKDKKLADSLIYVDPTDIEYPVGLNLFDVGLDRLGAVSPAVRETVQNGTIELYEYFFGGLLGAELTQKQGVVFRYLATLMTEIPGANIHTLRELMEDGERFKPYMAKLSGSAKLFFETRFFDRQFSETKKQILNRLWGVLANSSLDRMMSSKRNSLNLFENLQRGSVVFINTAKDYFGEEGSSIFGRMFVALLGQALLRRATIPKHERTPTYIYFDEAQDVIDDTLTRLLAQIRKYRGAVTFAHQNLDQIPPDIRAGLLTNTSIKLVGGVSDKDARGLAGELRTDADFLLAQRRGKRSTEFAMYARNVTEQALSIAFPLGYVEQMEQLGDEEYAKLLIGSQERYGGRLPPAPPPPPPSYAMPMTPIGGTVATDVPGPLAVPAVPSQAGDAPPELTWEGVGADVEPVSAEVTHAPVVDRADVPQAAKPAPGIVITRAPPIARPRKDVGHGGTKHKYLEHLVKQLGEERGFLVSLEVPVHDGAGRVDAVLTRGELRLAFEISVTTTKDHELGNVEKCLALPFAHVVLLASHKRHQTSLQRFIAEALEATERARVSFLLPEDVPGFLDGYNVPEPPRERAVKGYTVRSRVKEADAAEAMARRKAIAAVVARSIQSGERI